MAHPDLAEIEAVFQQVDRVAWIVTSGHQERRSGLVATWVSQCSIDPAAPLALIGLAPNHFTAELVRASNSFCLHLIDSSRADLALRFACSSGRSVDKFAGLQVGAAVTGSPVLAGCLSWLDCRVIAHYDAGDRIYFWADVLVGRRERSGQPLTESKLLALADQGQKVALRSNLIADRDLHRPLREAWRQRVAAAPPRGPDGPGAANS